MGVGKKKELAKRYSEKTDLARDIELGGGTTLGPRDVENLMLVDCVQTDKSVPLVVGHRVILIDMKKPEIEVYLNSRHVGHATDVGTAQLRERAGIASRRGRSVIGQISDVSAFSDSFIVSVRV